MQILETLKKPFLRKQDTNINKVSSVVHPDKVIKNLDGEELASAWYSGDASLVQFLNMGVLDQNTQVAEQAQKIDLYRKVAIHNSEVKNCVNEIVNEVCGDIDGSDSIYLEYSGENAQLEKAIKDAFSEICATMHINTTLHDIVQTAYVDGQLVLHLTYRTSSVRKGIQSIEVIDPKFLYFDPKERKYKYSQYDSQATLYGMVQPKDKKLEYSPEEIVRVDFGLYEHGICLSYLEFGIKNANILQTLEDLLVPLRFSRSISRRVFNVDVGNLPPKRVDEVMQQIQGKFKYKKFYNQETGEISNQQHITSMVEDYWFPNRSGGKGTSVDVLDETGNLGELSDINYYVKKLYRSLNVPVSRSNLDDVDGVFDFESTATSKEDMRFFEFTNRLRAVFSRMFIALLKRQVISKGIMNEKEFDTIANDIKVQYKGQNQFIEKMRQSNLRNKLDIFSMIEPQVGKLFSVNYVMSSVLGMSDDEIDEMRKQIESEEKDPKFKKFYQSMEQEETY